MEYLLEAIKGVIWGIIGTVFIAVVNIVSIIAGIFFFVFYLMPRLFVEAAQGRNNNRL